MFQGPKPPTGAEYAATVRRLARGDQFEDRAYGELLSRLSGPEREAVTNALDPATPSADAQRTLGGLSVPEAAQILGGRRQLIDLAVETRALIANKAG